MVVVSYVRTDVLTRCGFTPKIISRSCYAASFYLPSKCVRYFLLRLWHTTSSMKLHCVHFLLMLPSPWRNSRALIVTDASTRRFFLEGSCEHARRFHLFIKIKSSFANLKSQAPSFVGFKFLQTTLHRLKLFAKTNFVLETLSSSSTWLLVSLHAW